MNKVQISKGADAVPISENEVKRLVKICFSAKVADSMELALKNTQANIARWKVIITETNLPNLEVVSISLSVLGLNSISKIR